MTKLIDSGKLAALRGEFPGLFSATELDGREPLIKCNQLETFTVGRISKELLLVRPFYEYEAGNYVSVQVESRVFLLDKHFQVLAEVQPEVRELIHGRQPEPREERLGEEVSGAILGLEDPTQLRCVLMRYTGYEVESCDSHRESIGGYDVTLYKLPKRWSLAEWAMTERSRRAHLASTES